MTRTRLATSSVAGSAYAAQATELVSMVDNDPWGQVSWSPYETARVAALAPWLPGQQRRIECLLECQAKDGTWGDGPWAYRLMPTLSVVDALLTVLRGDGRPSGVSRDRLVAASLAGLAALRTRPAPDSPPDTAAVEIIVPGLVEHVNRLLTEQALTGPGAPLPLPAGYHTTRLNGLRARLVNGVAVPAKLRHTFEAIAGHCPATAIPTPTGLLGSSPAATAAWLGAAPTTAGDAMRELEAVSARYDGLFPEAAPFTAVERLWVLSALLRAGLPVASRSTALRWIDTVYGRGGVRGAPGLEPDADDTAMSIHLAAALGAPRDPAALNEFETPTHFACYIGEDTGSVTANARVLHALTSYLAYRPERAPAHTGALIKALAWVRDQQSADGYWTDKWHSSPYYATAHCVAALAAHGHSHHAISAAARWTEQTQRADGSWGHWTPTLEETAYAAQILLTAGSTHARALIRARVFLHDADDHTRHRHPPLWHDKTLYAPHAIIRAELAATRAMLAHTSHRAHESLA